MLGEIQANASRTLIVENLTAHFCVIDPLLLICLPIFELIADIFPLAILI